MADSTVFVRVRPDKIHLREEYAYYFDVSGNSNIQRVNTPNGVLEMIVPYDGENSFTSQIIEDIKSQDNNIWRKEHVDACIGHIGITNHSKTNLEEKLELSLNHGIIPLKIPIRNEEIQDNDSLRSGRYACRIKYDYEPIWPETNPLQISARIFDEEIIREALVEHQKNHTGKATVLDSVVKDVAQQVGFSRSLIFHFDLELALPSKISNFKENDPPMLELMAIEWPVATSSRVVHLVVEGKELSIVYNPTQGVIEFGDIPFRSHGKSEGTELYIYRTPTITLLVDQPGELYQRDQLNGNVVVQLPRQFSALKLLYFNAQGKKEEMDIQTCTIFNADLALYLEDLFDRKMFSPYQHLQFEGVVLDEMRVMDIMTLLEDQGFSSRYESLTAERTGMQRYLVEGVRTEGHGKLVLWMVVEGTRSQTTRQKQIQGGHTYTTQLETGNVVIYMRGQLQRDSSRLVNVMNEIQNLLKERFQHISTIE